jgi:agmatine deiminase
MRIGTIAEPRIRIPAEWEPHACCLMSWALRPYWGKSAKKVKRELNEVIQTIARYEPVRVLAPKGAMSREAHSEFKGCSNIEVIEAPLADIWMRDIAPTFAIRKSRNKREIVAIDWNFNGWGGASRADRGKRPPADIIAEIAGVDCMRTNFTAEGGALIFNGQGTAITTRSCLLNPNRNPVAPGLDRQRVIEEDLLRVGIRHVHWLEGDPSEPVTSGHIDGYVLLSPVGEILIEHVDDPDQDGPMWRGHDAELLGSVPKGSRRHMIARVAAPRYKYLRKKSELFAPSYLNAYVANGAVIGAKFGDSERDRAARVALERAFPKREVVQLEIDHIAEGGGGIHCLTQPMPSISKSLCRGKR